MSDRSGRATLRHLTTLASSPPTWPTALRASVAVALPLGTLTLAGHADIAPLAASGAFTVLYGVGRPLRNRIRVLLGVAAGLVVCAALGAQTAGNGPLTVILLTVLAGVATFVSNTLKPGPPGPFFFVLVAGVSGYVVESSPIPPGALVGAIAVGAAFAVPVALADLLVRPAGPQERAVAAAESAVGNLGRGDARGGNGPPAAEVAIARLHHAWVTLSAAGDTVSARPTARARADRLSSAQQSFADQVAPGWGAEADLAVDPAMGPLGLPGAPRLLATALHAHSAAVQAAIRSMVGVVVAGTIGFAVAATHPYWAVAAAMLVLYQGLDRRRSLYRALHRLVGTVVGLGLFVALAAVHLTPWSTIAVLAVLQGLVELLVPRNYAFAVSFITPLALTISTTGQTGGFGAIATERLLDTVIGLGVAVVILFTVGRSSPLPALRAQLVAVFNQCGNALDHVARGTVNEEAGRAARRDLAMALEELGSVAARAERDAPEALRPWSGLREAATALGVAVLARCTSVRGKQDMVMGSSWTCWAFAGAVASGRLLDRQHVDNLRADLSGEVS